MPALCTGCQTARMNRAYRFPNRRVSQLPSAAQPPSTLRVAPFTKVLATLSLRYRIARATSSGVANRPIGTRPSMADRVHPHVSPAPLGGQRARQPDQAVLAGVVGGPVGDPQQPRHRGHVHDAARPLLQQGFPQFAAQQERRGQVHLQHPAEPGGRGLLGGRDEADAGVVHQRVHPAPAFQNGGGVAHHPLVAQVAGQDQGVAASGTEFSGPPADALGRARDDRDPRNGGIHTFRMGPVRIAPPRPAVSTPGPGPAGRPSPPFAQRLYAFFIVPDTLN